MSTDGVNNYINFKILKYRYYKLLNNNLQEQYKEDFADFTEATFKACNPATIRNLRTLLRYQGVWVKMDKRATIAQSLYDILCKEDQMEWTIEEILDQVKATSRLFASPKLNRIAGLIPDILNQIRPINPSDFGIILTSQSISVRQSPPTDILVLDKTQVDSSGNQQVVTLKEEPNKTRTDIGGNRQLDSGGNQQVDPNGNQDKLTNQTKSSER